MNKEKCKICGMKTIEEYKKIPCCGPCYGKYGDRHIDKAMYVGTYGKRKVVINK